jgi:hypothetical protein
MTEPGTQQFGVRGATILILEDNPMSPTRDLAIRLRVDGYVCLECESAAEFLSLMKTTTLSHSSWMYFFPPQARCPRRIYPERTISTSA